MQLRWECIRLGSEYRKFYDAQKKGQKIEDIHSKDLDYDFPAWAMEDAFAGRMVFSGSCGDFVWKRTDFPLPWWTIVSCGLNEFRLRVGFIQMAHANSGH